MNKNISYSYLNDKDVSSDSLIELGYFSTLWGDIEYYFFAKKKVFVEDGTSCKYISTSCSDLQIENLSKILLENRKFDFFDNVRFIKKEVLSYFKGEGITDNKTIINKILVEPHKKDDKIHIAIKNIIENKIEKEDIYNKPTDNPIMGALSICYRIRNNLFHGSKELLTINKQINLFKAINAFLNSILVNISSNRDDL